MSRTPAYDPDAILQAWLAAELRLRPHLTVEGLMQAAALHFNRPHWLRQRPTYRVWQLALAAKFKQEEPDEKSE